MDSSPQLEGSQDAPGSDGTCNSSSAVMGDLLKEIQIMSPEAADALKQAGFETDSDIQSLTREDLTQLLPRAGDFKLRKNVFETIKKSRPPNMLLKELGELLNDLASSAQICLILDRLENVQLLLNDKNRLKNINTRQPYSKADEGAVMGDLLKEIQIMSPEAADVLKQAGFETDSDIQSLTREDLTQLLPRAGDFKLRKNVFEMIKKSRPPNMPLEEQGDLQNNLDSCAVMGDLLKEIQIMSTEAADVLKQAGFETDSDIQSLTREDLTQLLPRAGDFKLRKNVFEMIQKSRPPNMPLEELGELQKKLASSAQIDLKVLMDKLNLIIELLVKMQQDSKADKGSLSTREDHPQGAQGDTNAGMSPSQEVTVKYKMVVGGQTFGAHTQLMDQVKHVTKGDVELLENSQDSKIIIVFCPITSRVDSDLKAAMTGVPGDKPVILVKMHHVCESKSSLCFNSSIDDRNIVLQVNVFYHENLRGLLECKLNENAVDEIQQELLKHSDHRSTDTRASTSGQGPSSWLRPWTWGSEAE
ncbi:uncharacterized protein LOC128459733 isoform X3 [Pleuronectes platessa]|uniref:uncharacterized protein LOC128459733 isoform X3 n=1 Tax=Pleuronectes platessa TaxID=8262 RepID=UPI00232A10AD|nr:uncharacterized protein LOC128459733 isoform X3 [Pleuronectes platessa]XP_053300536.1 uncharacterized protein LOC128459733 isoform X3 [Pleuronectes platessa]